ncbi:MAG: 3-phosphoshikimate 1-carboxyvinyltransferase [Butyrivibrio sp.]
MDFCRKNFLKGKITVPGDKSISHRAVMFGSIAKGTTEIKGFLQGADCLSTIGCFRKMGVDIINDGNSVTVHGNGLRGLTAPDGILDVGNSGTTTRLISGILAGQKFTSVLNGDASIQKRPMDRVIKPLRMMGADICGHDGTGFTPLTISPAGLSGIHYDSPVASAQVKSCILLAGLYSNGTTSVTEPSLSRNHTELMLSAFGADIRSEGCTASIRPADELFGQSVHVPGDISSAAYFIAAGLLGDNNEILIENVGINPTRDGIIRVCRAMGGNIELLNERTESGEPVADLLVRSSSLHGTVVEGDIIPTLIDEIPVIAVLAAFADGKTVIRDAAELKVKESDRIATVVDNLSRMGADITGTDDGMIINGGNPLHGAVIDTYMDHRLAMSFAIAALNADGTTTINDAEVVNISYPGFYKDLSKLSD